MSIFFYLNQNICFHVTFYKFVKKKLAKKAILHILFNIGDIDIDMRVTKYISSNSEDLNL